MAASRKKGDVLSPMQIVTVCLGIVRALRFLHEHNIAHRDLKSDKFVCVISVLSAHANFHLVSPLSSVFVMISEK